MTQRIGMIGLAEAGNLGDDLIAIAAMQTIAEALGQVEVHFISHGRLLDWGKVFAELDFECVIVRHRPSRDLPLSRRDGRLLSTCDAVILGGGGLLQTTHHPQRPYHWLRFVPSRASRTPVIAVGLGLGPLNARWTRRLRDRGIPFDECFLRDDESLELSIEELHWPAKRCRDFVDARFLNQFLTPRSETNGSASKRSLGVALRAWPGLDVRHLATHIDRIALQCGAEELRFFVLEANSGSPDIPFTKAVMGEVTLTDKLLSLYEPSGPIEFVADMSRCDAAISMKLHSGAIWAAAAVPTFPISYAPKTASFFGVPYTGLEIFSTALEPPSDEVNPRAQDVLASWLMQRRMSANFYSNRSSLAPSQRLWHQVLSFLSNIRNRLPAQRILRRGAHHQIATRSGRCAH